MKEVTVEGILCVINSLDNIKVSTEQLDESLLDLGMDSISFIQIIVGLEETFDCEIPDSKLLISEMDTIRKMLDVLQELYEMSLA
jgi:acyl carrier protein